MEVQRLKVVPSAATTVVQVELKVQLNLYLEATSTKHRNKGATASINKQKYQCDQILSKRNKTFFYQKSNKK